MKFYRQSGIYRIYSPSGNFYIGSSVNLGSRINQHRRDLKNSVHRNINLLRAFEKYGEALKFEVLIICEQKDLLFYEQLLMDKLQPKYNICKVAGRVTGFRHSEEEKQRQRERMKSFRHTEESRAKISLGNIGKFYTQESRLRMSESAKKRANTENGRAAMAQRSKGAIWSDEARKAAGERSRGRSKILDEEKVYEIKRIHKESENKYGLRIKIASTFGITREALDAILSGRTWAHVK